MGNTSEHFRWGHSAPELERHNRFPWTMKLDTAAINVRGGEDSDGVYVGDLVRQAIDYGYADDGGAITDDTADLNDAGADDVDVFPATEAVDDAFYFGMDEPFVGLDVNVGVAGAGGSPTVAWEYWNGTAWTAVTHLLDSTVSATIPFAQDGFVTWAMPDDWVTTEVGDGAPAATTAYWVRVRLTAVYATTEPLLTQAWALNLDTTNEGAGCPFTGYITHVSWNSQVTSGANNDTVINILNSTRNDGTSADITQAVKAGRVAVTRSNGLYCEMGDEIVIQVVQEDGTTEFEDLEISLHFKI